MIIHRAFKYRLCPNKEQAQTFKQLGGNTRFLYNKLIELAQEKYQNEKKTLREYDMSKLLPTLKQEFSWLSKSYSQSLQQVSRHLWAAYEAFFEKTKGYPNFKKKSNNKDSFAYPQNFEIGRHSIQVPKLGRVRMIKHRPLQGKPKSITISQDGDQWFISILCEIQVEGPAPQELQEDPVGIDLGLKYLAVLSDGEAIENPAFIKKHEKKIKKEQRSLSRKQKGSQNRAKQQLRLYRAHRKLRNARKDFRQKATSQMITKHGAFCLENLNIRGMLKNHKLAKAIQDAAWGEFVRTLEYKASALGKPVIRVGQWFPSSQLCSECGARQLMPLNKREYICEACGLATCRDLNAARNIQAEGIKGMIKNAII